VEKSAGLEKIWGYLQIPGSIPAETPSNQYQFEQPSSKGSKLLLAWIWTNFLSKQHQATDFEPAGGRAATDSLHDARARLKISSQ